MKKLLLMTSLCVGLLASCSSSSDELIEDMNDPNISTSNTEGLPKNYGWDEIFAKNGVSSRSNLTPEHEFYNGRGNELRSIYEITPDDKFHKNYVNLGPKSYFFLNNTFEINNDGGFTVKNNTQYTMFTRVKNNDEIQFHSGYNDAFKTFKLKPDNSDYITLKQMAQNNTGDNLSERNFVRPIINMVGEFRVAAPYTTVGDITNVEYVIECRDTHTFTATYDKKISNKAPKTLYGLLGFKEFNYPTTLTFKRPGNVVKTYNFTYHKDNSDRIRMLEISSDGVITDKYIFFYN